MLKNIYLRCLKHSLPTKVTIDSNPLITVAEINSSIEMFEVIRVKITIIISGGDPIAVGNVRLYSYSKFTGDIETIADKGFPADKGEREGVCFSVSFSPSKSYRSSMDGIFLRRSRFDLVFSFWKCLH
jgi:hypothetical protein